MKYLLLICGDMPAYEAMQADESFVAACHSWAEALRQRGALHEIAGLAGPAEASTLRVRDGQLLLTDGPFAETKEVMAGFSVIECAGRDEAVELAARHPAARYGTLEIRPFAQS